MGRFAGASNKAVPKRLLQVVSFKCSGPADVPAKWREHLNVLVTRKHFNQHRSPNGCSSLCALTFGALEYERYSRFNRRGLHIASLKLSKSYATSLLRTCQASNTLLIVVG